MKLIENNILLLSSNLFTKIFVPTKNKKLINVRIHPTAKQNENFLGDIIINGNKKKLNTKIDKYDKLMKISPESNPIVFFYPYNSETSQN